MTHASAASYPSRYTERSQCFSLDLLTNWTGVSWFLLLWTQRGHRGLKVSQYASSVDGTDWPAIVETFCQYMASVGMRGGFTQCPNLLQVSAAFALLNMVACGSMDGQHAAVSFLDHINPKGLDKEKTADLVITLSYFLLAANLVLALVQIGILYYT